MFIKLDNFSIQHLNWAGYSVYSIHSAALPGPGLCLSS